MDLCRLSELKTLLEQVGTNIRDTNKYDDLLSLLIKTCSAQIESYCNRPFDYEERTENYDGDGENDFIYVRCPPIDVNEDITVWDDTGRDFEAIDVIETDSIVVYPFQGKILYEGGAFAMGHLNVRVTYTGGYKASAIPDDLHTACLHQCSFAFRHRKESGLDSISTDLGSITLEQPPTLLKGVRKLLDKYVVIHL